MTGRFIVVIKLKEQYHLAGANQMFIYLSHARFPSKKANALQSLEMARALYEQGALDVYVCFSDLRDCDNLRAWVANELDIPAEFPIVALRYLGNDNSLFWRIWNYFRLAREARKYTLSSSVLYVRDYILFLVAFPLFRRIVLEIHQWSYYSNGLIDSLIRFIVGRFVQNPKVKIFVTISKVLQDRWISVGIDRSKTIVLHDAISEEYFREKISRSSARSLLKLGEKPLVLYAGSMYLNRDIEWYLKVAEQVPDVNFMIIGGDQADAQYWSQKVSLASIGNSNITFLQRMHRRRLRNYLYAADVLVFTMSTRTRTFDICSPLKIFEYMAAGKLIVAPNLDNLREVLAPSFAEFYEIDSFESFVIAVNRAVARQRTNNWHCGDEARVRVFAEYTWNKRATSILTALMH